MWKKLVSKPCVKIIICKCLCNLGSVIATVTHSVIS